MCNSYCDISYQVEEQFVISVNISRLLITNHEYHENLKFRYISFCEKTHFLILAGSVFCQKMIRVVNRTSTRQSGPAKLDITAFFESVLAHAQADSLALSSKNGITSGFITFFCHLIT